MKGPARQRTTPVPDSAGLASFVLIALVWGIHWPVVRIGLGYVPPYTYGAARVVIALVAMIVVLGVTGGLRLPPREDLGVVVAVGLGQMATRSRS